MRILILTFASFFLCAASALAQTIGHTSTGLASYYSDEFHGSTTKYGATYNRNEMVAAHKMYPFNSQVRVTNLENNRSVVVRIIDKGPYIQGRIIEVSYRAAEQLRMLNKQTARVMIELIGTPEDPYLADEPAAPTTADRVPNQPEETRRIPPPPPPTTGTTAPRPAETRASDQTTPSASAVTTPTTADNEPAPQTAERVVTVPATAPPTRTTVPDPSSSVDEENQAVVFERANNDPITTGKFGPGIYKIELREPDAGNYGVQVASLTSLESALQ
ncbi:MAG: septal ring lytic transglycosylase RlpA family protein, partial [Bacteroidota bacterium]